MTGREQGATTVSYETSSRRPVVPGPLRWAIAAATSSAAVAHLPVIGPHLHEAPYMGVLFVLLTVACLALAAAVLISDSPIVYASAAAVCGLAMIGYAATRLVAFPQLADDVGNWLEPLGVLAVCCEATVVALSIAALGRSRRSERGS